MPLGPAATSHLRIFARAGLTASASYATTSSMP